MTDPQIDGDSSTGLFAMATFIVLVIMIGLIVPLVLLVPTIVPIFTP